MRWIWFIRLGVGGVLTVTGCWLVVFAAGQTSFGKVSAVFSGMESAAAEKVTVISPACWHKGQDLNERLGAAGWGELNCGRVAGGRSLDAVARKTLVSAAVWISSSKESKAWEISDLIDARDRDLSSVPYRSFTRLGRSEWITRSQVSTTMFSRVGGISSSLVITSP